MAAVSTLQRRSVVRKKRRNKTSVTDMIPRPSAADTSGPLSAPVILSATLPSRRTSMPAMTSKSPKTSVTHKTSSPRRSPKTSAFKAAVAGVAYVERRISMASFDGSMTPVRKTKLKKKLSQTPMGEVY